MFRKLLSFLSDSAVYGVSGVLGQVAGFLLLPLYTRCLSTADYGASAQLQILFALFVPIANLGMSNSIFRNFSTTQDKDRLRRLMSTALLSVVVSSVLCLVIGLVCS